MYLLNQGNWRSFTRKLIVCNIISLDGFYAGPNDDVMVMPFDRGFDEYNAERFHTADTLLLGRKSYELFRSYWPAITDDVTQPAVDREISRLFAATEKIVVSRTLKAEEMEGWGSTRVVRHADVYREIAVLKQQQGKDILVFGSHMLWNDLLSHDLVDELHFMIGAGVLAEGVRAFEEKLSGQLQLADVRAFTDSNLFLAKYLVDKRNG